MSWFSRSKTTTSVPTAAPTNESCTHERLGPRGDRADDMGKSALATSFVCEKCHVALTPDEGRALLATRG